MATEPTPAPGGSVRGGDRPATRTPATHCRRDHAFTPENTWWNSTTRFGPDGKRIRTRLCARCARDRQARCRARHPEKVHRAPRPRLPALPADPDERILECAVRRIVRERKAERAPAVCREARKRIPCLRAEGGEAWVPVGAAVRPGEMWGEYAERTGAAYVDDEGPEYGAWFVSRMLMDPRVEAVLDRAGCRWRFDVAGTGASAPRPFARLVGGRLPRGLRTRRPLLRGRVAPQPGAGGKGAVELAGGGRP